ncbi:MAG: CopG family ribbon-helix-helix protein [Desulfurococcaceae archaeon]|nr:CopG family ribbon-helix-helix protein [Desulfurococcaceae archaeon]MCC6058599.1 CopG family ribbon-helix-helix protein [Desulfurococcaceae archaeon]
MDGEVSKPLRVGVYIPKDLAEKLLEIMKDMGIDTLSRIVQESIRLFIAEHSWRIGGEVVGAIGVLYDHEVGNVDEELTDIQHRFLSIVISSMHVHLDERNCLLMIIVRGSSDTIKKFVSSIEKIKGVKLVRLTLIPRQ